jgi:hypothetical protein
MSPVTNLSEYYAKSPACDHPLTGVRQEIQFPPIKPAVTLMAAISGWAISTVRMELQVVGASAIRQVAAMVNQKMAESQSTLPGAIRSISVAIHHRRC